MKAGRASKRAVPDGAGPRRARRGDAPTTPLRLVLLGGFELHDALQRPIGLNARKARGLLAYLALARNQRESRDTLARLLWGEGDPAQSRVNLRQALTALRRALGDAADASLQADAETVALVEGAWSIDAIEFASGMSAADLRVQALALYRGDLLASLDVGEPAFEHWASAERERLRRMTTDGLEQLMTSAQEANAVDSAIAYATRLVTLDPLRESGHRALMRLYQQQGRVDAALRQYRTCRAALVRELGITPDPETERVHRSLFAERRTPAVALARVAQAVASAPRPVAEAITSTVETRATVTLPVEPTPRQVAIIAATLVDGVADAEEHVHRKIDGLWTDLETIAARYGGRCFGRTFDRAFAIFGALATVGDEAERALRTVLALRRKWSGEANARPETQAVGFGIATGRAVVSTQGTALIATGEAAQLAARLGQRAARGDLLLERESIRAMALRAALELAVLEGSPEQADIARVVSVGPWRAAPPAAPLIGREVERQQLEGTLDAVSHSAGGRVVLIRGEPGIGKTRMVEELAVSATRRGFATHRAQVVALSMQSARIAGSVIVRGLLGILPERDPARRAAAVNRAFATLPLDRALRPVALALVGAPFDRDAEAAREVLDAGTLDDAITRLVVNLIIAAAAVEPLLIVVEDVHWSNAATLEALSAMASAVSASRAMLALTTRIESDPLGPSWRASAGVPIVTIDLSPLLPAEARRLARSLGARDDALIDACVERAAGNPFFLAELVRAGERVGESLPASIQALVMSRMDQLPPGDREALRAAAVIGQRFGLQALRFVLDDPHYDPRNLIEQLFIRAERVTHTFVHALVHDAVVASMLKSRRQAFHRRAAEWFAQHDPALEAEHMDAAEDPRAAAAYLRAAQIEWKEHRFGRPLELIERGLDLATEPGVRFELLMLRGEMQRNRGTTEESLASYREAAAIAPSDVERARARVGIASCLRVLDRHDEALAALAEAERLASAADDALLLAELHSHRSSLFFPMGRMDDALREGETALALARRAGSGREEAWALSALADAHYARGRFVTADRHFSQCVGLAREHRLLRAEAMNLPMRGLTRMLRNDGSAGLADCQQATVIAERIGDARAQMVVEDIRSLILLYTGDWRAAADSAAAGLVLARRLGARRFLADFFSQEAAALAMLGERVRAHALFDEAMQVSRETGFVYSGVAVLGLRLLVENDRERRTALLAEGKESLHAGCVSHCHFIFRHAAMEAALVERNAPEAIAQADALAQYMAAEPFPWGDYFIRRARLLATPAPASRTTERTAQLHALRGEGERAGWLPSLALIDAALARA